MSNFSIKDVLNEGVAISASDIHVSVGVRPAFRLHGELIRKPNAPIVTADDMEAVLRSFLTKQQIEIFNNELEFDFSFEFVRDNAEPLRFRGNFSYERGNLSLAFRIITPVIRTLKQLLLPESLKDIATKSRGLFIVTGPTGSGKSTTLAALVQEINATRAVHIVTIEDPIEYIYKSDMALVHQREVGHDTKSFAEALRRAMRQDPDVIMLGELRDLETISAAVTAAETGHLVLATLHTPDAPQSIDRIIDVFPPFQQQQVRVQLSSILLGILSQQLIPVLSGTGRVVATEYLVANSAVKNHIRESKTSQMKNTIQTGAALGMHTMDQDIARMYKAGHISKYEAIAHAHDPKELDMYLSAQNE